MTEQHGRFARRAEDDARAKRLRNDWYTRAALRAYLANCSPLYCDHRELLQRYDYLDHVPEGDFRWGRKPVLGGYDADTVA